MPRYPVVASATQRTRGPDRWAVNSTHRRTSPRRADFRKADSTLQPLRGSGSVSSARRSSNPSDREVTMLRSLRIGAACVAVVVGFSSSNPQASQDAKQAGGFSTDAALAAKASPDLVGALSKELGSSPEQAAGAAGALFGVAKSQLKPEEFSQISKAVPGMASLLKAAPAAAVGTSGAAGALAKMGGSASGLASAASAFSKLGLKPEMVAQAVPV